MPTHHASMEEQKVREIAERYRRKGYTVHIEPGPLQIPGFLSDFRPDLIAEAPDEEETVVVEVKATGTVSPDYWSRLARAVASEPKWRLELLVTDPEESTPRENLTVAEIQALVREGISLNQVDTLNAALLILWGATEATLRLVGEETGIELPDEYPGTLITRLYMDGPLEREDYDLLSDLLRLRNDVAHGFRRSVSSAQVELLQHFVEKLLAKRRPSRRRLAVNPA